MHKGENTYDNKRCKLVKHKLSSTCNCTSSKTHLASLTESYPPKLFTHFRKFKEENLYHVYYQQKHERVRQSRGSLQCLLTKTALVNNLDYCSIYISMSCLNHAFFSYFLCAPRGTGRLSCESTTPACKWRMWIFSIVADLLY